MKAMLLAAAVMAAAPALAEEPMRDFCGDRPGLGTPACTVDKGHLQIEFGIADWTLDRQPDIRTDTILLGDALARYGIGDGTELRLGWTAYGHQRQRDRASGAVDRVSGVGDVMIGLKQNLAHPDGKGLSVALLPYATLPVGKEPIGKGDWGAGLLVPVDYELSDGLALQLTPEVDAEVDEDGHGRHLAYSGVAGLAIDLSERLSTAIEAQLLRDRDPSGHQTMALAALSIAYKPQEQTQLDIGANAGLNRHTPDVEVYLGVSRKF